MDTGSQAVRLTNVDIDNALDNNHFQVIFQPIFDLADGSLMRVESFVRWTHPGLGVLPPGAFISFFESQGRMGELTRHVVTTALDDYIAWRGTDGPGLSINLAQSDVTEPDFAKWFTATLKDRKFPARLITLECPALPSTISVKDAAKHFTRLRKTGARLAIEVRGRANDLLRTIDPFPFDELKTGGSAILRFARTMRGGPGLTAISELLDLAKANNAGIIAVGVEDQPSLKALAGLGFTGAQGNYLATIRALDSVEPRLVSHARSVLSLEPVGEEQLEQMTRGVSVDTAPAEAISTSDDDTAEDSTDTSEAAEKKARTARTRKAIAEAKLTPEKLALLKKKAAEVAARKRAEKKAAEAEAAESDAVEEDTQETTADTTDLTASPEQVAADLNETHNTLREVAARKQAEENARRLQSRLSQAYELPHESEIRHATAQNGNSVSKSASKTIEGDEVVMPTITLPEPYTQDAFKKAEPDPQAGMVLDAPKTRGTEKSVARTTADEADRPTGSGKASEEAATADTPASNHSDGQDVSGSVKTSSRSRRSKATQETASEAEAQVETDVEDQVEVAAEEAKSAAVPQTPGEFKPGTSASAAQPVEETPEEQDKTTDITAAAPDRESEWYPKLPHFRSGITGSLRLTGISETSPEDTGANKASEPAKADLDEDIFNQVVEPDKATEGSAAKAQADTKPDLIAEELPVEPVVVSAESDVVPPPQVDENEEIYAAADEEIFKSEDEVLDEAFEGAAELDPTKVHADDTEGPIELDSTEREIAGRLRGLSRPRRKSWLMRRHRIMPTHFWPRAWKRKWEELRADNDADNDDGDYEPEAEPAAKTGSEKA
ncbi:EAL domain-containing protein [Parvularcula flava]|uniref:EAL domain-containing protein n=1 Tax=Aquisalinus luteolus TaxID=1566827 RepID=A0A8J3A3Q0_9PROT|nr:EAL domain-containing protein [Aquisalinus luteolus]NHK27816.1 EAL domain-containing protein [Aquisalinus luteolus]GGH96594.1 hypothetical protein GCM10011355_15860 [Aquisalinus luteolus]